MRLRTERTCIEPVVLTDVPFFQTLMATPGWIRFIGQRDFPDDGAVATYLEDRFLGSYRDYGFGYYVVRDAERRVPMGICGFLKKPDLENPDFGFAFLPEFCGQGFAIEASRAVFEHGVKGFGFKVLDAVTVEENVRSIRLLSRLGFRQHGTMESQGKTVFLYRWEES